MFIDDKIYPDDVNKIYNLVCNVGVFNDTEVVVAKELAEEALLDSDAYSFLVARNDESILAYTCFSEIPLTDKRFDLYWIAVAKDAQGSGLSAKILRLTEDKIREKGGKALYAETSGTAAYNPARQFYFKQGYQEVARFKDFYRDGDDKVVYGKFL